MKMRATFTAFLLLAASTSLAEDKFQPLNVKAGLWESTTATTMSGEMPIPPERLARLTPEQRARIETALKARSGQNTRSNTYKTCETKEKLQKTPFEDKQQCKETIISSTSSHAELNVECTNGDIKTSGTLKVDADSDESVKGSGHMTATAGGRTMNSDVSFTSKWLGASCGDVK
jgi:hypothetical protein